MWSDWTPPSQSALARIPDRRARQFWDPQHLVSRDLVRAAQRRPALPGPSCCLHDGLHWDEAILYSPGSHWQEAPAPAFWDGAVAEIIPRLEQALGADRQAAGAAWPGAPAPQTRPSSTTPPVPGEAVSARAAGRPATVAR
ncbi:MAG TPA: hypothetical protein VJA16_23415 [Thermoanaerobaculia bacterium]